MQNALYESARAINTYSNKVLAKKNHTKYQVVYVTKWISALWIEFTNFYNVRT